MGGALLRIACIQPQAYDLTNYQDALENILMKIDEASKFEPQLIVIPECVYPSYYLGLDEQVLADAMDQVPGVIEQVGEKAQSYQSYIAFGLVVEEKGKYYNRGLLFDPQGNVAAEVNKSFMWHFDNEWFGTKESTNIIDTPFGKWGMIICADGRMPEIVRDLALKGVDLVIDLANLTSTGKDSAQLTNAQSNFMLSTRALENNIWLVMADKVGVEANTVVYSGRSSIISPEGKVIVEASPDHEEIIFADIDPTSKNTSLCLDVLYDRNRESYNALLEDHSSLPLSRILAENIVPSDLVIQGASVQYPFAGREEYLARASFYIKTLESQMADVILLPYIIESIAPEQIQALIEKTSTVVFYATAEPTAMGTFISCFCVTKDNIQTYRKTHLSSVETERFQQGFDYQVIETPRGNFGMMIGEDGLFPEVARILTLKGADCIVWINEMDSSMQEKIARTRAAENKVFVMTSSQLNKHENTVSFVADPNGNIIASTLEGNEQALATQIPLLLSRCKMIVPSTHATLNRKPENYGALLS
jgi:predicted amidohydrolase